MGGAQLGSGHGLGQIPPEVLKTLPAIKPPPGLESNFLNPEDKGYLLVAFATVLFSLMSSFFASRLYTKIFIIKKASWDDLTCAIGFVGSIGIYISGLWGSTHGNIGKHEWDVKLVDILSDSFIIPNYIIPILNPVTLLFIKLTFFLLYLQVFRPLRWLRITARIGATVTCAFYGACTVTQIIYTSPRRGETLADHVAYSRIELQAKILSVPLAAGGLVIDVVLLAMPIVAVLGLQLPIRRKIGIMCIFMFGIFACVGSILSIYYRAIEDRATDATWTLLPVELVMIVESNIGIMCACMPSFSKMLHHHLPPFEVLRSRLYSHFSRLGFSKSNESKSRFGSTQADSRTHYPKAKPFRGPYNHVELEASRITDSGSRPAYELGQTESVRTFIGRGKQPGASDDKIHLTHEIRQHQAAIH